MGQGTPWHEDDSFWEAAAPAMFTERRWAIAPAEVEAVLALVHASPGMRVLDLCCGVGRHSIELARRGHSVTGVDRSAAYLESARRRAAAENLSVEFVLEDMRRFVRPGFFDLALSLFTSFGYFDDPGEDRRVVENVFRSLRPGAAFVIDLMGKEVLARIFCERDWYEEGDTIVLQERRVTRSWSRIESRWILLKGNDRKELRLTHRLYSAAGLAALLETCGFAEVEAYGDLRGAPYDHKAARLVVLGRKGPDAA